MAGEYKASNSWTTNNKKYVDYYEGNIRALSPGMTVLTGDGGQKVKVTVTAANEPIPVQKSKNAGQQYGYVHIDQALTRDDQKPVIKGGIVTVARSQVDYHGGWRRFQNGQYVVEFPTGNKWVKYWTFYDAYKETGHEGDWCAAFVSWCAKESGASVPLRGVVEDMISGFGSNYYYSWSK